MCWLTCNIAFQVCVENGQQGPLHTKFLLTEFLEGKSFAYGTNVGNDRTWVTQHRSVQEKCAADIAMSNYDVAGPGYSNLLVSKDKVGSFLAPCLHHASLVDDKRQQHKPCCHPDLKLPPYVLLLPLL